MHNLTRHLRSQERKSSETCLGTTSKAVKLLLSSHHFPCYICRITVANKLRFAKRLILRAHFRATAEKQHTFRSLLGFFHENQQLCDNTTLFYGCFKNHMNMIALRHVFLSTCTTLLQISRCIVKKHLILFISFIFAPPGHFRNKSLKNARQETNSVIAVGFLRRKLANENSFARSGNFPQFLRKKLAIFHNLVYL